MNNVEKSQLKRHQRQKHKFETNFKSFQCLLCNKQFLTKYLKKLHLQAHTGVKLDQCYRV